MARTTPIIYGLNPTLLVGLWLLMAIVGGYTARFFHVPRVIGFLLGGVVLRTVLSEVASGEVIAQAEAPLAGIKQLALGVILFTIGGVFERSRLRAAGPRVRIIGRYEILCTAVAVSGGCLAAALLSQPAVGLGRNVLLCVLLGLAAIATAPAATLLVLQEYEAKGPITETILGLTGLNNIVCIICFYGAFLIMASFGLLPATGKLSEHLWLSLLTLTAGSLAVGIILGTALSMVHARLSPAETLLVFLALFILLGAGERHLFEYGLAYNFLLTALVTGGVFANLAMDTGKLEGLLQALGSPLFACFFVMAGFDLHISDLAAMGWIGAAYVLLRAGAKVLGCALGIRHAGQPRRARAALGGAMLCQAAVVIGLADFLGRNWGDRELARQFSTIILGSVVIFELIGPLLVKRCVVQGGEVKAVTLLRRSSTAVEGDSLWRITLRSLQRLFRRETTSSAVPQDALTVQHIMRRNVDLVPASSTFDDVLHFMERSTYNHFPVVQDDGVFVGMIHFSDVQKLIYDPALGDLVTAVDICDPQSVTVPMNMPLQDLLDLFTRHNVGVLPVVGSTAGQIIGLVEQRDLLRALHRAQR